MKKQQKRADKIKSSTGFKEKLRRKKIRKPTNPIAATPKLHQGTPYKLQNLVTTVYLGPDVFHIGINDNTELAEVKLAEVKPLFRCAP